jgi:RsiW-degrading membrane proteinase PrsW (M82 family)
MEFIFGLLLTICIPLIFLYSIRQLDFYQTGQFQTIAVSLILGGIAFTPAAVTNWTLNQFASIDLETIERFIAPFHEELIKGLFLLYILKRSQFSYSVDGLLYGLAVGIGFAVVENIFYMIGISNAANIALQRIFTSSLVHAFSGAALGITLVTIRSGTVLYQYFFPAVGLFFAIGQHMLYNNVIHSSLLIDKQIHPAVTYIPGLFGGVFIYVVIQFGRRQAQKWIKENLGMIDRVTWQETEAVNRFATTDDILLPIVERFGPEKASQVEELLYHQARIGIKRKSLDSNQGNQKVRTAVEAEIREMQEDMEKIRRDIGTYVMLFVRGLFTEEMVSVWGQLQAKTQERSAATGGQKGGGVWKSLDERLESSSGNEGSD